MSDQSKGLLYDYPPLLTVGQVAEIFQVTPLTIKRWGKRGILPPIRINSRGDRRYTKEQVLWLIGQQEGDKAIPSVNKNLRLAEEINVADAGDSPDQQKIESKTAGETNGILDEQSPESKVTDKVIEIEEIEEPEEKRTRYSF